MHTRGCEWIVDAHGCDPTRLADVAALRALFARLIALLDLRPIAPTQWHCFPAVAHATEGGGVTGMALLAESHLTLHTFPEHGSLCLNLFCCRPRADWDVRRELEQLVGSRGFSVSVRRVERVMANTPSRVVRPASSECPDAGSTHDTGRKTKDARRTTQHS